MKNKKIYQRGVLWLIILVSLFTILNTNSVQAISTGNSSLANLTIYDDSDSIKLFNSNTTFFYANWTNITNGKSINNSGVYCNLTFSFLSTTPFNMTWNASLLLYTYSNIVRTGQNNYTIICDGTLLNYGLVNVTDLVNITNRAPVNDVIIPNITLREDTFNDTLNMTVYFADADGHDINYTFSAQDGNISISINNITKIANITLARDFYGSRYANITAIDAFSGNATSNIFWINVSNLIEINLTVPISAASSFVGTDTFDILAVVEDDYNVTACSLLLNGTVNQTITAPNIARVQEIKYDDGAANGAPHRVGSGPHGILTKKLNTTNTDIKFLSFYVATIGGDPASPMNITINNNFFANISINEIAYSCSSEPCWIHKPITNSSMLVVGTNNISFNGVYDGTNTIYWAIYIDTNTDNGMSSNTAGDITGEYMVRFQNVTNILNFSNRRFSKGNYQWNVNCTNNQSTQNSATTSSTFAVQNSAPTTPSVSPSSGTYDTEINISCASTDADNDNLTYDIQYYSKGDTNNVIVLSDDDSDGNYTWNVSLLANQLQVIIRCTTSDGINTTTQAESNYITISHPNAVTSPNNLTCNSGNCTRTFNETINLTATGSNLSSGTFSYYYYATYDDVNGTNSYFIGSVSGLNTTNNTATFIWNVTQMPAQASITLEVLAFDGLYNSSRYNLTNQLTINNTNAPTRPTNITPSSGSYNISQNLLISANGSTDINGENSTYRIFALYDNSWHLINSTMTNTSVFSWNFSSITEQTINLSVQATDGRYYSPILRTSGILLVKPPTIATNITPNGNLAENVYEYELNYSCTGANNSNFFTYAIDMNYSNYTNATLPDYKSLNATYPGVLPVNDSSLAYDDNSYSYTDQVSGQFKYRPFASNISNYNYRTCIAGYGTNSKIKLYYNCKNLDCRNEFSSCNGSTTYQNLATTETEYCYDLILNATSNKFFCLETIVQSSGTATSYIDSVILTAKALIFNLTNITPQRNVQLRCKSQDDAGSSDYLYSNNTIIIDRKPVYNGSSSATFNADSSTTINISQSFYDPDAQNLTFYVPNYSSALTITYNFSSNYNILISSSTAGTYYLTLRADDSFANTTYNLSITVNPSAQQQVGGGGSASTTRTATAAPTNAPAAPSVAPPAPTPPPASSSSEQKPIIEEKPVEIKLSELAAARKISIISRKHPEPQNLFGTTKIFETIKNIDLNTVDDVKVKITIPKDIIKTTDEIAKDDTYYVIERDPVIEYPLGSLEPREERIISYTIKKDIKKEFITDNIFKVELSSRTLTKEEEAQRQKKKEELIQKTKEVINVSVSYNISKDGSAEIVIDIKLLNKTLRPKDLVIQSLIPKCLIEKLDEEFKKKNLKSDIDFDILKADPLTQMNLGDIDDDKQFKISLSRAADINCDDPIEQEAFAKEILPEVARVAGKVNYIRAIIELLAYLALVLLWWKISTLEAEPEKTHSYKRFFSKKYAIFSLLFVFLVLNTLDVLGKLPADAAFYKNITSFIAVGYTIYKVSITKVLFGEEHKHIDLALVFAFFLILAKATVATLKNTFKESELSTHFVLAVLKIPALEEILLLAGALAFFIIALYLSKKIQTRELSLASLILTPNDSKGALFSIWKFLVIFGLLGMFYVAIYQLAMEWFTIVIDSVVMIVIAIILMLLAIKHHHKANVGETLEESESAVEAGYRRFFKLFRFHKTAFLALAFISTAFIVTEIFVYIVPYTLGLEQAEIYLAGAEGSHLPLFSVLGKNLFAQNIVGLPMHGTLFIATIYLLNVLGMFLLLGIPMYVLYHVTKNIDKPLKHVSKSDLPTWAVAIFMAAVVVMLFIPVFKIQPFNSENVAGIDIQTKFISTHFLPNILGVLVAAIILGYLMLNFIRETIHLDDKRREHHYLIGAGIAILCISYILSYISTILYGKVLFIEELVNNYETSYIMFVVFLALIVGYLVYYYTSHSKRHEMLFEYIALGSVIIFFAVYYFMYVSDIVANHWHLLASQIKLLEFTNGFGVRVYLRAFVLLFTSMLYVFEFLIYTGSFLAFIYILYSRNELGIHKYNLPFLKRFDQLYDLHHATAEIVKGKMIIAPEKLKLLQDKITKGIQNNFSPEDIIGHLISHDWHINDILYAVLHLNIDDNNKNELLYSVISKYEEEIDEILAESKHPVNIAQDLVLFDCTTEQILCQINNSKLAPNLKDQIKQEFIGLRKLQKDHHESRIEKQIMHILEKEHELEQKQEELEAKQEEAQQQTYISKIAAEMAEPELSRKERKAFENDKRVPLNRKRIDKIKRLALEDLKKGHIFGLIISKLESTGYNIAEINTALFELSHEQGFQLLMQNAAYNNDVNALNNIKNLKLAAARKKHIGECRKIIEIKLKGMMLHQIVSQLLAKGWKEQDIAEAIKDIRLAREEDKLIIWHINER